MVLICKVFVNNFIYDVSSSDHKVVFRVLLIFYDGTEQNWRENCFECIGVVRGVVVWARLTPEFLKNVGRRP